MLQGKRDVDTVLTMGIMEDVSIVPQPAGGNMRYCMCVYCIWAKMHYAEHNLYWCITVYALVLSFIQHMYVYNILYQHCRYWQG